MHEIFTKVNNAKDKPKKVAVLKNYDTPQLRAICKATFEPSLSWLLPEGDVPFMPNDAPEGTEHSRLEHSARTLQNYLSLEVDGKVLPVNSTLNPMKRETMFIQLLEGLCEAEARVLIDIKNRVIHRKYKGLNATVVKEAFGWSDDFMPHGVPRTRKVAQR